MASNILKMQTCRGKQRKSEIVSAMKSAAAAARPGDGSAVTAAAAGVTRRSNQFTDDQIKKKVETTKERGQIREEGRRGSGITA